MHTRMGAADADEPPSHELVRVPPEMRDDHLGLRHQGDPALGLLRAVQAVQQNRDAKARGKLQEGHDVLVRHLAPHFAAVQLQSAEAPLLNGTAHFGQGRLTLLRKRVSIRYQPILPARHSAAGQRVGLP